MKKCGICLNTHNHLTCPYCGSTAINGKYYDVGRMFTEVVRGISAPRIANTSLYPSKKIVTRTFARLVKAS